MLEKKVQQLETENEKIAPLEEKNAELEESNTELEIKLNRATEQMERMRGEKTIVGT